VRLKTIILVAGVLAPAFSVGAFMNLFSGFTVEREVILSPDKYNTPSALLKAADGGYFVLCAIDEAWITKTDAIGNTIWTYQKQSLDETTLRFKAAAPSTDGGVLICGERNFGGVPRRTTGLLILLDKNGKEISRLDSYKQNPDQGGSFFSITSCSSWGSNFAISGAARISERESNGTMITRETPTLMKIKGDGSLTWQMNVDTIFQRFQAMPDGGLVLFGDGVKDEVGITAVMKVDSSGSIQASESLDPSCRFLAQTTISSSLRFICNAGVPNSLSNYLN
jgi:hypothetical protein